MKHLYKILLIAFVLISVLGFSQEVEEPKKEDSKPKHEVRIIMENFFGKRKDINPYDWVVGQYYYSGNESFRVYADLFDYGVGYNFNMENIGFRTRVYYKSSSDKYYDYTGGEVDSKHNQYKFALGLNYQLNLEKSIFFAGIDVSYFNIKALNTRVFAGPNQQISSEHKDEVNYSGFGIEPLVGIKYFLSKNISLSTEVRLILDYFDGKINSSNEYSNSVNNDQYNSVNFSGKDNNLGPKGSISLNIHF